jgi:hypothetical protein
LKSKKGSFPSSASLHADPSVTISQLKFIVVMRAFFLLLLQWGHGAAVATNRDDSSDNSKSGQQNLNSRHRIGAPTAGEKGDRKAPNTPLGRNLADIQPRIVGGDVSEQGEFPYFGKTTADSGLLAYTGFKKHHVC